MRPIAQLQAWFRARWRNANAEHRAIFKGMLWVGMFAVLGKLVGAAKEMTVAWRYGVSAEVDAYLFVTNLLTYPVGVWFAVIVVVLIPMEARIREERPRELSRFRREVLGVTVLLGLAIVGLAGTFLPGFLGGAWAGLPAQTAALAIRMARVLVWLPLLGLLVSLYSTWTMSEGRHANTLFEGAPALGIMLGVLLTGGTEPLIWGTLAGTMVQLGCLAAPIGRGANRSLPSFRLTSPEWSLFMQGFGVMIIGQATIGATTLVDQLFAARLGEGAISSLGYAGRILAMINGIVATAITRATLPVFARSQIAGSDVRRLAGRWAALLALAGAVVIAVGWFVAPFVVRLLFQRGTFTAGDTTTVAHLLRLGLIQLPFYFSGLVYVSLHSSHGRYGALFLSGILGLAVKTAATFALLDSFGVGALMLSAAAVYAANALFLSRMRPV